MLEATAHTLEACTDGGSYPGASEVCDDGIDQDCDGADEPCPDPTETTPTDSGLIDTGAGWLLGLGVLLVRRRR